MRFLINFRFDCFVNNINSTELASPLDFFELNNDELSSPINIFPKCDFLRQNVILPILEIQKNKVVKIENTCILFVNPVYKEIDYKLEKNFSIKENEFFIRISQNNISIIKNGILYFNKSFKHLISSYKLSKKELDDKEIVFINLSFKKKNFIIIINELSILYNDFVCLNSDFENDKLKDIKLLSYNINCYGYQDLCTIEKDKCTHQLVKKKTEKYSQTGLSHSFKFLQAVQFKSIKLLKDFLSDKFNNIPTENVIKYFGDFNSFECLEFLSYDCFALFKDDKFVNVVKFEIENDKIVDIILND